MIKQYKYINVNNGDFSFEGRNVIIWGLSESALSLYVSLTARNVYVIGFTDSFVKESGHTFVGLPVYTFDEISEMQDIVIYISTSNVNYLRQILNQTDTFKNATILCKREVWGAGEYDIEHLRALEECEKEEIEFVSQHLTDEKSLLTFENLVKYRVTNDSGLLEKIYEREHKQYFPEDDILRKGENEVFVDAGAYNGETSYEFAKWTNDTYEKIYMMEPDSFMNRICEEYVKIKNLRNIEIINQAAYSCSTELEFNNDYSTGSSTIVEGKGTSKISTVSIDDMLNGKIATFIKMDVEGAEMKALEGCENTIKTYRPKLAISIYHNENDLWKIPGFLMKKYPFYKFYIRHYTPITTETVLYATT